MSVCDVVKSAHHIIKHELVLLLKKTASWISCKWVLKGENLSLQHIPWNKNDKTDKKDDTLETRTRELTNWPHKLLVYKEYPSFCRKEFYHELY